MHVCMYVDAVWNNSTYNYPLRQNPGKCRDLSSNSIGQGWHVCRCIFGKQHYVWGFEPVIPTILVAFTAHTLQTHSGVVGIDNRVIAE